MYFTRIYGVLLQVSLVELLVLFDISPIFFGEIDGEVEEFIVSNFVLVGEVLKPEVTNSLFTFGVILDLCGLGVLLCPLEEYLFLVVYPWKTIVWGNERSKVLNFRLAWYFHGNLTIRIPLFRLIFRAKLLHSIALAPVVRLRFIKVVDVYVAFFAPGNERPVLYFLILVYSL